ncbi:MAG: thiamine pyrophosphate-dependent enzyme [Chloroflexota bacterium]
MTLETLESHPLSRFLRVERFPLIWCEGCGLGIALGAFARALQGSAIPLEKVCVVSGIGCTGRIAGYVRLDSFHTTHGRAIPFATGLQLANPELKVVVISGDGDLFAIGGNHLIHAARRNMDMVVICVNNFIYGMTGGQVGPTTPSTATATTAPYGNYEKPFNLCHLADSCGAVFVARWTLWHTVQLQRAISTAFWKKGFSFIEVISPCPVSYERRNGLGDGLARMEFYRKNSVIRNGANTGEVDMGLQEPIIVGNFVNRERDTYLEAMNKRLSQVLGERYVYWGKKQE